MSGSFDLKTAHDLREKLRRDLEKLKARPLDSDAAFNFFVTAEHMLDWVYPKNTNKQKRTDARKNSVLLQVCSHLANGAKHFEVEDPRHDSVSSTGVGGGGFFPSSFFPPSYFPPSYFGGGQLLIVGLRGDAAKEFGRTVGVVRLAEKIMDYWDKHPMA